jgi:hypothetical protein
MSRKIFRIVIILLSFLLQLTGGCTAIEKNGVKAVYLAGNTQQLSSEELAKYPEVIVVNDYAELKENISKNKAAIWIDKSAVSLVDDDWLHQEPQKYYPVILIGYNDPLYSFRDTLPGFDVEGPYVDWSKEKLEPGFSLWCIIDETDGRKSAFGGFDEIPTVERILIEVEPYLK